ncbi:hypothetical protein FDW83_04575 [Pseudarthrobacter sp. NamE2]|uniref:DUF6541 family protein n=1 Tax=Pseudarthrobacter sp. NamE2 TaxID=2576838 RepID=UPI0010FD6AE2|nr:DUF6541 family protein [Pseudarthrobacter sp. NamE2]TLM85650.1 hypothetical protein FDW83_04575 [Pseudarthrobacter sp. NamE2]
MSWFDAVPQFVLGVGLLFLPGLAVAFAARLRGVPAVALAPGISLSIIAVSAIAAPFAGLSWSLLPVLALTFVVAALAFGASVLLARTSKAESASAHGKTGWMDALGPLAAVGIAAVLIGRRVVHAIGQPESFSQTFDNVFHLNAVRYILDTGSGSSLTLNSMTGAASYPAAWHDLVSLVVGTSGSGIPLSVNVINIIVAAVVWPLGCIYLARTILGPRTAVSISAGILAAAFGAFPMSLLDFGVLYPNFLAVALLPMVIAVALEALGLAAVRTQSRVLAVLLLLAVLPGLALAHPSAAMAWMALMLPPAMYAWGRALLAVIRSRQGRGRVVAIVALVITLVVAVVVVRSLWEAVRPPAEAAFWPPVETSGQAIGEVISSSAIGRPVAWAVMVLTLFGAYATMRSGRQVWWLGTYAVAAFLFLVVSSFPADDFRMFVSGIWYNDPPRLAALLPLVTVPLACHGAVSLWDLLMTMFRTGMRRPAKPLADAPVLRAVFSRPATLTVIAGIILAMGMTAATQRGNVRQAEDSMSGSYRLSEDSPLISTDELALIQRLPDEVPEDALLVGNPWNGSSLAYALADRKLVQLHILSAVPEGTAPLLNGPAPARDDPDVCPTVERLKLEYILDFGHREVHGRDSGYKGLDRLIAAGMATLEDSEGEARLYKLQLCSQ